MASHINAGRAICAVALAFAALPSVADAATFVIDGIGSGIVASTTGVATSSYNFATVQSAASSFSQTFSNQDALGFDIIWRNPAVPFMTGISTSDVIFTDAGRIVGFLRYAVNNAAAANIYHVNGTFYDGEFRGSYPTPQGTSVTTVAAGPDFVIPNIAFLDMTVTVRTAGSAPVTVPAIPEPSTWMMMILGFAVLAGTLRRRAGGILGSAA